MPFGIYLKRFREATLKLKNVQVHILYTHTESLGHAISHNHIKPLHDKIQAIPNLKPIKNITQTKKSPRIGGS